MYTWLQDLKHASSNERRCAVCRADSQAQFSAFNPKALIALLQPSILEYTASALKPKPLNALLQPPCLLLVLANALAHQGYIWDFNPK